MKNGSSCPFPEHSKAESLVLVPLTCKKDFHSDNAFHFSSEPLLRAYCVFSMGDREERERGVAEANSDNDPLLKELRTSSPGGQQIAARGRDSAGWCAAERPDGLLGVVRQRGVARQRGVDGEVRAFGRHGDERRPGRLVSPRKG